MLVPSIFSNNFVDDIFDDVFPFGAYNAPAADNRAAMNTDEKGKDGKYIRKERYYGSYQRSFYVGDGVTQDDIKGGFENGILTLTVPKKEAKPAVEEKKYISIEG